MARVLNCIVTIFPKEMFHLRILPEGSKFHCALSLTNHLPTAGRTGWMSTHRGPFILQTTTGNTLSFLERKGKEGVSRAVSEQKRPTRKSGDNILPLGTASRPVTCADQLTRAEIQAHTPFLTACTLYLLQGGIPAR